MGVGLRPLSQELGPANKRLQRPVLSAAAEPVLIECADYSRPVGVERIQDDLAKLCAAREHLRESAVVMHVSRNGYTPEAAGYAADAGISAYAFPDLQAQLINFEPYFSAVEADPLRSTILMEYQPNRVHFEASPETKVPALRFLEEWLASDSRWLTLLGDYGVGKSWTLKMFLYELIDKHAASPESYPLPLFIPLQRFTKAFDFETLVIRTLQIYGVSGVFYSAFEYLMHHGRIVFLLDSFDEMAQQLGRQTIRDNLKEMLVGISTHCRAIMTSRPNYFEGRAERLLVVDRDGVPEWHPLDVADNSLRAATSRAIQERLHDSQFARICDLTLPQRKKLFEVVLGKDSPQHRRLVALFDRFQNLETLSQRAVIARLLTTVAATISQSEEIMTVDGYPLLPEELSTLNEAKVFEIVVYNLLYRDKGIGTLSTAERLLFLRAFAVLLQQPERSPFATPDEVRHCVATLFSSQIRRSDTPEQLLESYYRTCRRHSGLTTEGQFRDTTGQMDMPVDELDTESRVGFSHNSLREYLIADALAANLKSNETIPQLNTVIATDAVGDFFHGIAELDASVKDDLSKAYEKASGDRHRDILFSLIYAFIRHDPRDVGLLGTPARLLSVDLSNLDMSSLDLRKAVFEDCVALEADLRKSDLRGAVFQGCILENVSLNDAIVEVCDFRDSEIVSIYVYDEFDTRASAVLTDQPARQWLYSHGALVSRTDDLNPLLGQAWYEAAREVTKTLERRIGGSHQDVSLAKGTKKAHRTFARQFVQHLVTKGVLTRIKKSDRGPGYVVRLKKEHRTVITDFSQKGRIAPVLQDFFDKHLKSD